MWSWNKVACWLLGHNWGRWEPNENTTADYAVYKRTCLRCGDSGARTE